MKGSLWKILFAMGENVIKKMIKNWCVCNVEETASNIDTVEYL